MHTPLLTQAKDNIACMWLIDNKRTGTPTVCDIEWFEIVKVFLSRYLARKLQLFVKNIFFKYNHSDTVYHKSCLPGEKNIN